MGDTAAETLREIEEARARLTQDLDVLATRLPDRDEATRGAAIAGGAVAGAGLGIAVLVTVVKRRRARSRRRDEARKQAHELALALKELRADDDRDVVAARGSTSPWKAVAIIAALEAAAAAVYLFVRNVGQSDGSN